MTPCYTSKKHYPNRCFRFFICGVLFFTTLTLILFLSVPNVYSVDITLAWDENTEEDLAGYRIFYREEGQSYDYDTPAWEDANSTCTIYNLDDAKADNCVVFAPGDKDGLFDYLTNKTMPTDFCSPANAGLVLCGAYKFGRDWASKVLDKINS